MATYDPTQIVKSTDSAPPRERPWLLSCNRKLRHLQGITIRNLTLTTPPTRSRKKTIDDAGLPSSFKSPTKAVALRESKGLAHSRSSDDLKAQDVRRTNGTLHEPTTPTKQARPGIGKGIRRRTTMEWVTASPLTRQKKLEEITAGRMADTFFSLHVESQQEPIYVSEVAEKAMNPNFRFFDLGPCGPNVTRLDKLAVRVWAKCKAAAGWQYLMNYTVHFRALQFIGKSLGKFRHPLPHNCILFYMTDGIYTSFTNLPMLEKPGQEILASPKEHVDGRMLSTSSYDALMRLSTLDDCIQDALTTRDRIANEIEDILADNAKTIRTVEQVPECQESLQTVQAAVAAEKRRVAAARRRRDDILATISYRKEKMRGGQEQQIQCGATQEDGQKMYEELKSRAEFIEDDVTGQRRRVCEDLLKIFPIEPVPSKSLAFTICGLLLPNSVFDDAKEDVTSAALGCVAQVVSLLSLYLSVILPYPIVVQGSMSTIEDPLAVSHNNKNNPRIYPLYLKGVVPYRFEYAVFLLNKNIEILSNALELRPIDIRQTLPNLKYLLYVATAGKGELPARKAGGIKGLLRQDGGHSRKSSMDSTITASSAGTPSTEPRRNFDSVGTRLDRSRVNGTPVFATISLKQKDNAHRSRLRPIE